MVRTQDSKTKHTLEEYHAYLDDVVLPKIRAAVKTAGGKLSEIPLEDNLGADSKAKNYTLRRLAEVEKISGKKASPEYAAEYEQAIGFAVRLPDWEEYEDWNLLPDVALFLRRESKAYTEEVLGDMVTIKQIVMESGQKEGTVRARIDRAMRFGILKHWEKQGGTILVNRAEALKIASAVGVPMVKMGRPKKVIENSS